MEPSSIDHELDTYIQSIPPNIEWQKKSNQVYAAMVQVHINGNNHYIPGINVEISLPTGSLCAERNAISNAIAQYPQIQKDNFVDYRVKQIFPELKVARPCGVCQEWINKIFNKLSNN